QFAEFGAVVADLLEGELRAEELGTRVDERGPVVLDQLRWRERSVELGELRLVVEQFEVARRAAHEQVDDPLGLRGEVRLLWVERRAGSRRLGEQRVQGRGAE